MCMRSLVIQVKPAKAVPLNFPCEKRRPRSPFPCRPAPRAVTASDAARMKREFAFFRLHNGQNKAYYAMCIYDGFRNQLQKDTAGEKRTAGDAKEGPL